MSISPVQGYGMMLGYTSDLTGMAVNKTSASAESEQIGTPRCKT